MAKFCDKYQFFYDILAPISFFKMRNILSPRRDFYTFILLRMAKGWNVRDYLDNDFLDRLTGNQIQRPPRSQNLILLDFIVQGCYNFSKMKMSLENSNRLIRK